nr:glycosyltransferase family 4 protein [Ramlibacter pallidus]
MIHVMNGPRLRGAETFAVQLAEELARCGVRQRIVFLKGLSSPRPAIDGCEIAPRSATLSRLRAFSWLRAQLRAEGPSVVLCHGQGPLKEVLPALAFRGGRRPALALKQIGMILPWLRTHAAVRKALNRWLLARTDMCICLGPKQAEELNAAFGVPAERIAIIPNGRRSPSHPGPAAPRDASEILVVGSLSPEKNPALVLDLLEALRRDRPDLHLTFVGDGPLRPALEREVEARFPQGAVQFAGQVADVWPFYRRAGIHLLCSETEGVPGVVIEATLAGLPTVAWEVGDVATVLEDGVNGRLTPFSDRAALLRALAQVAGDPASWQRLREGALEISPRFDLGRIAREYVRVLDLLPAPPATGSVP